MVNIDGMIGRLMQLMQDSDLTVGLYGSSEHGITEILLVTICEQLNVKRIPPGLMRCKPFTFKRV